MAVILCSSIVRSTSAGSNRAQHVERPALHHRRHEERCAGVRERRTHQEARRLRPLPLGELHLGHRGHRLRGADDALRLPGGPAGVGDRDDVVGREQRRLEGLGLELLGRGGEVATHVGELVGHRTDGQHLGQSGHLLEQADRPLHEHRDGVDDQRGDAGVVEDVGVVVEGAQRVQRRTPEALGLSGAEDEQHLRPVQREQRGRRTPACTECLEGLHVLADPARDLASGQGGLPEVHHRIVPVALECRDHQVAVVGALAEGVGHARETRTCYRFRQSARGWTGHGQPLT